MKFLFLLIRLLVLELLFCQFFRVTFVLLSPSKFDLTLLFGCMRAGLDFDLGISLLVLFLLINIHWILSFVTPNFRDTIFYLFFFVLILVQSIAAVGDIILYKYWDSIFSVRAYPYLKDLEELTKNVSSFNIVFVAFYFGLISLLFFYARKIVGTSINLNPRWYVRLILILILAPASILCLRGGFREIPRNQSDGFFCDQRTYNIASINSTWNFFNVLIENKKFLDHNPYLKLSDDLMLEKINEMQRLGVNRQMELFSFTSAPNVVLITMEGVSAEVFKLHNGYTSYLPLLESLLDSSYYFTNAYSVGSRTEQGLGAFLTGSLATPFNSVTDNVSTLPDLPSILTSFNDRKYHTRFVFGGNVEFANMRAYLNEIGFDTVIDIQHFPKEKQQQSLGVPDEFLFNELIRQFRKMKSPFFLHTLTLSTHEPFDVPELKTYASEKKMYLQSVRYLDRQLERFFNQIRGDKKFENTLFIITSDHSHKLPNDCDIASKERYHIPLIIYSQRLNHLYKGYRDSSLFAQHNFPATLSYLMKWKEKNYLKFSRNHFSDMNRYAMSSFVNGYLYQTDTSSISYDYVWRPYDTTNVSLVKQHSYPQAILQYLADQIRGVRPIKESRSFR
ncbi:MAG: LTA synthase family protein [Chitinophagales bacterium]